MSRVPPSVAVLIALATSSPALAQDIVVIAAPANQLLDDSIIVRDMLYGTWEFARIDTYDARNGTPTLDYLENFHAAYVWSEVPFADPVALGDVLADYVELGHGVVVGSGALQNGT